MITTRNQPYRPMIILMIILTIVVGVLTGCASVFQNIDERLHRKRFKPDYAAFEKALAQYTSGDFEKARARFEALSTASASQKIARRARLGEICCRLILAHTRVEYTAAVGMWYDFRKATPENQAVWDVALLDPLILRLTPENTAARVIDNRAPAAGTSAGSQTGAPPNRQHNGRQQDGRLQDDRRLQTELDALKKKVEGAEELQRQMDAVMAENRSLKKKIKALEAIDQNIQKKKTEISAPSE